LGARESATPDSVKRSLQRELNEQFDERLAGAISNIPAEVQGLASALLSDPRQRAEIRASVERWVASSDLSPYVRSFFEALGDPSRLAGAAQDGQIRALRMLLDTVTIPDAFQPTGWSLVRYERSAVILGDSCVVVRSANGAIGTFAKLGDSWSEVF